MGCWPPWTMPLRPLMWTWEAWLRVPQAMEKTQTAVRMAMRARVAARARMGRIEWAMRWREGEFTATDDREFIGPRRVVGYLCHGNDLWN